MGNSLQDQLLKAGLVNQKQLTKANQEKRRTDKQQRKTKAIPVDQNKLRKQQEVAAKAERDRRLNRQRELETERKAIAAQIKQLIEAHRLPKAKGEDDSDVAYNFADKNKIKKIYVSASMKNNLIAGKLAIVKLAGKYELVPTTIAEKIRSRDEKRVILCNDKQASEDENNAYAEYQVPDDLMW